MVALWAQLYSVIELVAGVAMSGIGAGLSVLVAQAPPARRAELLDEALRLGLGVAFPVAAALAAAAWIHPLGISPAAMALACAAGWLAIAGGLLNSYWLGQEHRGRMLALAAGSAAVSLAAAAAAPASLLLETLTVAHAAPVLLLLVVRPSLFGSRSTEYRVLRRYVLPGVAIGILSPASLLASRALVADALSWHDAGVLQALWRLSDWICAFAWGVLSVFYLPRLAAASPKNAVGAVAREAFAVVVLPATVLFVCMYIFYRPLLAALYDPSFAPSGTAVALVFAGSLARIASWVPLAALYATLGTRSIAAGELLSLPLFAALLAAAGSRLTLELAGAFWLAAFLVYGAFNSWAVRKR
ncbi:MAG: hypothetical protein EPO20_02075 [Betaproteobacteria bacterium]|nr:MAG: hypothetical protein EPO20_02075 [Betaproteobacteria bacterium]